MQRPIYYESNTLSCIVIRSDKVPLIPPYLFSSSGGQCYAFSKQLANGLSGHKIELSKLLTQGLNL